MNLLSFVYLPHKKSLKSSLSQPYPSLNGRFIFRIELFLFILFYFSLNTSAFASPGLNYQGRLLNSSGEPISASSVTFNVKIKSPGTSSCLLYEENHTIDMSTNPGYFSFVIGNGSRVNLVNSNYNFEKFFSNKGPLPCGESSGSSYSPNKYDNRIMILSFSDGTNSDSLPPLAVNFVPFAIEATQISSYTSEQIIKVKSDVNLSTNPLQTEFNSTQWSELLNLIGGVSSNYLKRSEAIGAFSGDVTGTYNANKVTKIQGFPVLNSTPTSGQILIFDGTQYKPVSISGDATLSSTGALIVTNTGSGGGTTPSGITSIQVGSNLTASGTAGGTLTSSGTIDLKDSGITAGTYTKLTINNKGLATSGGVLSEEDIPSLSTAGKVSGTALNSGTIGGSTAINTTGSIITSGSITSSSNISSNTVSANTIYSPTIYGGSASDVSLTLSSTSGTSKGPILIGLNSLEKVGIGTSTPQAKLDVNGAIKLGTTSATCSTLIEGTQRYYQGQMQYCNGSIWTSFNSGNSLSFGIGSNGSSPNWTLSGSLQTLNIPYASTNGVNAGLISYSEYNAFNNKLGSNATFGGDVSGTYNSLSVDKIRNMSISTTPPSSAGQVLRFNGSTQYIPSYLSLSDLRSTVNPSSTIFPTTSCSSAQTLTWSSLTDTMTCSNISISSSAITDTLSLSQGGTGSSDGSISASGALSFSANGTNNDLTLNSGAGGKVNINSAKTIISSSLGIGTSSPTANLDVNGTANFNGVMKLKIHSYAPFTCTGTDDGTIAMTSNHSICVCDGPNSTWILAGGGTCNW